VLIPAVTIKCHILNGIVRLEGNQPFDRRWGNSPLVGGVFALGNVREKEGGWLFAEI